MARLPHALAWSTVLLVVLMLTLSNAALAEAWGRGGNQRTPKPAAPLYPIHPRVDINWTLNMMNKNITRKELKKLEKEDLVLTKLVVINRHGHRAPNAPYWTMCPNDIKNKRRYSEVNAEDLSGLGMQEEYDFGQYIRAKYHEFLGDRFNRSLHFFRAVGEPRILQSAVAVAQGIFPDGFGPGGFLPSRPQFVPIFSDMDTHEYLLDDVPCFRRAENDSHRWMRDEFPKFLADPEVAQVVTKMQEVCGSWNSTAPLNAYIKTVADGMTFNSDLGLKICGGKMTPDWVYRVRRLSLLLLMKRLYNTDEQQTYTVVDLPRSILMLFNHTHVAEGVDQYDFRDTRQESTFFFVHREALYAFAQFFGFEYHVPGLPPGELPVASSLIMEKLMRREEQDSHEAKTVYIRMTLWTPHDGSSTIHIPPCRIPEMCEMHELRQIYETRVARTGTWEQLCGYVPQEIDHTTDIR